MPPAAPAPFHRVAGWRRQGCPPRGRLGAPAAACYSGPVPALQPHPATPAPGGLALAVEVGRPADLELRYTLRGDLAAVVLPPLATPGFADELWRHTCFEAFLARDGEPAYVEYNFSPSGRWAAYGFSDYRRRRALDPAGLAPAVDWQHAGDRLTLTATIPLAPLGLAGAPLRVGATAVIEARDGARSYWALRHPPGAPDFHRAEVRALRLPPRRGSADR